MKINGTIFSKPQQDQLKRAIENIDSGTTLNKYVLTCIPRTMSITQRKNLCALLENAKGNVFITYTSGYTNALCSFSASSEGVTIIISNIYKTSGRIITMYWNSLGGQYNCNVHDIVFAGDGSTEQAIKSIDADWTNTDISINVTYWNDTEIEIGE